MMLKRFNTLDWGLVLAILLPLIGALPTWGEGIAAAADVEVHVHRIHAITLAVQNGDLYPRWISYFHLGYGYPIFNYYAPGYAYFTALFELAGLPITIAYNLAQTLAWSFGSAGMYLLARRFLPVPAAVLAAGLWALAPSRLYEVWWQGSIAQIMAASFIPYLLLGVIKNSDTPSLRRVLAIALPYVGLIMTHTPMLYISTLYAAPLAFLAPMFYTQFTPREIVRRWVYIGGGFVLGVCLSAIFLMPTLLELPYVQISQGIDETVNYLLEQYLPITEIFTLPRLIDSTDRYLDFPRTLGLVGGVLALIGTGALLQRRRYGLVVLALAGMAFTLFMLLEISFDLWMTIPAFANLRFPARLLRIGAVLIALLGGASVLALPARWQVRGMIVGLALVIAQILPISQPYAVWLNWDDISAYDEILHEHDARTWGTVSYNEFNPIWGEEIFLDMPPEAERYIDNPFHLRVYGRDLASANWQGFAEENINDNTLRVTTDQDRAVRFRQYYFPGWQATVNGERAEMYPDEQLGLITLDLPAGEHVVSLRYVGTPLQLIATVITLLSVVVSFGLYYFGRDERVYDPIPQQPLSSLSGVTLVGLVIVLAVGNAQVIQVRGWFKYHSPPTDPHYMQTRVDAVFEEQITLLGYSLHDTQISPGGALALDLYWHVPETLDTDYRPVVQLVNLSRDSAWATSSRLQPSAGEFSTLPADRFARDPYRLRLFETGIPPYVGQIQVQLIGRDGALTLADGSDRLILEPIIRVLHEDDGATLPKDATGYQVGDIAELICADVMREGDLFNIGLGWALNSASAAELVVMVQGLDTNGELITSGDAPPFGGDYPSLYWQDGQRLSDAHYLPYDAEVSQIAIGLYERETLTRLPVIRDGVPQANGQIILSLEERTCSQ
ncbi:MAG: 6-pyruvoyl-tetrahydropterin synthase-related protein [Anaerolineae bacterium]